LAALVIGLVQGWYGNPPSSPHPIDELFAGPPLPAARFVSVDD
jgi:hypothetical protein